MTPSIEGAWITFWTAFLTFFVIVLGTITVAALQRVRRRGSHLAVTVSQGQSDSSRRDTASDGQRRRAATPLSGEHGAPAKEEGRNEVLNLTDRAGQELREAFKHRQDQPGRLRVFIDQRCQCGKAHFSLVLDPTTQPGDMPFEAAGVPFIADEVTAPELASVEIDYLDTEWTKGFTIRNVDHRCGSHVMGQ